MAMLRYKLEYVIFCSAPLGIRTIFYCKNIEGLHSIIYNSLEGIYVFMINNSLLTYFSRVLNVGNHCYEFRRQMVSASISIGSCIYF